MRVAWCPDLGGLPLDPRVRAVLEAQRADVRGSRLHRRGRLSRISRDADDDLPDHARVGARPRSTGRCSTRIATQMKPEAIDEIEAGLALTTAATWRRR